LSVLLFSITGEENTEAQHFDMFEEKNLTVNSAAIYMQPFFTH